MTFFAIRRARLRPEYAGLYPWLVPAIWLGARSTARTIRRRDPEARRRELDGQRLLPAEHFEFQGGGVPERTRASDGPVAPPVRSAYGVSGVPRRSADVSASSAVT
jgi:hypothetical protein